jgi:cell division protein FtsQ
LLGNRRVRKNCYKGDRVKKRSGVKSRIILCFKLSAGLFFLGFMSFAFIFCYNFITQWDYFMTKSIEINGAVSLPDTEIIDQTGITEGENILSINLSMVRKRLLGHPWVAQAEVRRELPSRVVIRVTEHKPLAVIDLGQNFLINDRGEMFKKINEKNLGTFPVITGLDFSDFNSPGEQTGKYFTAVLDALKLWGGSNYLMDGMTIKRIDVDRDIGLTLYMSEKGRTVMFDIGYDDYPDKYGNLKNVLSYLNNIKRFADVDLIDLKSSNRIVIRPVFYQSQAKKQKEV